MFILLGLYDSHLTYKFFKSGKSDEAVRSLRRLEDLFSSSWTYNHAKIGCEMDSAWDILPCRSFELRSA